MAICKTCKEAITGKEPIIVDELDFCSDYCVEFYRTKMKLLAEQGSMYIEKLGPIGDEFINMCRKCGLTKFCFGKKEFNASYEEETHEWLKGKWCCHSVCNLSTMLSDGTVPPETVKKIMRFAEQLRDSSGARTVFPSLLDKAISNMGVDLNYRKMEENLPEPRPAVTDHYMACVLCDEETVEQCLDISAQARENLEFVQQNCNKQWCGHAQYALASALLGEKLNRGNVKEFIENAEKIAEEKGEPGVTHRSYYLALGRGIQ